MSEATRIDALWFDGRSARPQPVQVWLAAGVLHVGDHQVPTAQLTWPERQRHGQRQLLLRGGGVLAFEDAAAFDAWAVASGRRDSRVVQWQQSWRLALLSLVLLAAGLGAGWRWLLPWGVTQAVPLVPVETELSLGRRALKTFDDNWLKPSRLSPEQQQQWVQRFADMMLSAGASPAVSLPPRYEIHFRDGGKALGPNAFALPGGDIVVTDDLLELLQDEPDAVLTILGHELGHVQHRDGLRMLMHAGVVGTVTSIYVGDFSALLAAAPALMSSAAYSRDNEREADAYGRALARAGGVDAARIAVFFERVVQQHKPKDGEPDVHLPIAFASHPPSAERIAFFTQK